MAINYNAPDCRIITIIPGGAILTPSQESEIDPWIEGDDDDIIIGGK